MSRISLTRDTISSMANYIGQLYVSKHDPAILTGIDLNPISPARERLLYRGGVVSSSLLTDVFASEK